ncbi:hypothetical protein NSS89_04310 [Caldifermentibacillus hisashii]|uniref:hypothetical protein n=1 Tax=Caldifermentibacillus hisashii TaxID=996558 RepID=UPI0031FD38EF
MATRSGFVAKKWCFSPQNGDENRARRQKMVFLASKWRRDRVSSPKNGVSRLKMVTRSGLVAKKSSSPPQNGDEIRARHQNRAFFTSKR